MKTYHSRVSLLIVSILYLIALGQGIFAYYSGTFDLGLTLILLGIITLIVLVFCLGIKYVINGTTLEVYLLGVLQVSVDIRSITSLEENHNIISAPAASLDRLWVCYGKGERVNISPRHQKEFIAEIEAIKNAK